MNCKWARAEIALWAGEDLDERAVGELERHVAVCPACRAYRGRMVESLNALRQPESSSAENLKERRESVWPTVSDRLSSAKEKARAERLNRWLPAAAAVAACLAIIAFTHQPEPPRQDLTGRPILTEPLPLRSVSEEGSARWVVDPWSGERLFEDDYGNGTPNSSDTLLDDAVGSMLRSQDADSYGGESNFRARRVNFRQD